MQEQVGKGATPPLSYERGRALLALFLTCSELTCAQFVNQRLQRVQVRILLRLRIVLA